MVKADALYESKLTCDVLCVCIVHVCVLCVCVAGEEDGEEMVDEKALTKRDIHTLNEQRRRDIIKV